MKILERADKACHGQGDGEILDMPPRTFRMLKSLIRRKDRIMARLDKAYARETMVPKDSEFARSSDEDIDSILDNNSCQGV